MRFEYTCGVVMLVPLFWLGCGPKAPAPTETAATTSSVNLDEQLAFDPKVETGVLDNGLTWFVEKNDEPKNRIELRLAVKAGSVYEDEDQQGIAHYVEHMAFNGTEHFEGNDLIEAIEAMGMQFGAHLNAHTSFAETVYKLQYPADDPEAAETAMRILRDWAGGMRFDSDEMEKERGVVLEEWRRSRGAGGRQRDEQIGIWYHGSQYAKRLPIGTETSLKTFELDAARRFYADWYHPERMAVMAVGDFDADEMTAALKQAFGDLEPLENARETPDMSIPDHDQMLVSVFTDPEIRSTGGSFTTKLDMPQDHTVREYRENMVDSVFAMAVNQRLATLARSAERPFAGAQIGSSPLSHTRGTHTISVGTENDQLVSGLGAAYREVRRAAEYGFYDAEITQAKAKVMLGMQRYYEERDNENSRDAAGELVRHFITGEPVPGITGEYQLFAHHVPAISSAELTAWAIDWFPPGSRAITVAAPSSDAAPTEEALRAMVAEIDAETLEPWKAETTDGPLLESYADAGTVSQETIDETHEVVDWVLSNGMRVQLKTTDFKADEVKFRGSSLGGLSLASDDDYVMATSSTNLVRESGVGRYKLLALGRHLAGHQVSVTPTIGSLQEGMSGSFGPDEAELALQLIYATFTAPRFDDDAFQLRQANSRRDLENRLADPNAQFADLYDKVMWNNHRRRRAWTVQDLELMDLAKSEAFFKDRFADPGNFTFTFVGNVDLETFKPLVEKYLASLPTVQRDETWRDPEVPRATGVNTETLYAGLAEKGRVKIVFNSPFTEEWQDRYTANAMSMLLTRRLREAIRENLGGTYSIGARVHPKIVPVNELSTVIDFQCDPSRAQELTDAVFAELDRFQADGIEASELENTKKQMHRGHEVRLEDNSAWLAKLSTAALYDEPREESFGKVPERIDAITAEAVLALAETALDRNNYVKVVLLPESMKE
jgi:zinc protease